MQPDPRRTCRDCLNLNKRGECMAATRLGASVKYRPVQDQLRNCREFIVGKYDYQAQREA